MNSFNDSWRSIRTTPEHGLSFGAMTTGSPSPACFKQFTEPSPETCSKPGYSFVVLCKCYDVIDEKFSDSVPCPYLKDQIQSFTKCPTFKYLTILDLINSLSDEFSDFSSDDASS